ncbi:MAG: DUF2254 domain-containing protein [Planctomycetaceae bacterium]|nr:DUF2254 domain-containing protein [Planctomycetaceae bacterium]
MFKVKVFLLTLAKKMWPKVTLFAFLAVLSAFLAVWLRDRIPDDFAYSVDAETIASILNILASSMLAVTTFSLTVMVQAYSSATTTVTPRATQLVVEDHTAHNILATFLGTFVFSLMGIIALNAGIYQAKGRIVLFVMTILVVVIILVMLIRWIEHLTKIGRVAETTRQVQAAAEKAFENRTCAPCLGCNRLDIDREDVEHLEPVYGSEYGYVRFIDIDGIAKLAKERQCDIYIMAVPGKYVYPQLPLLRLSEALPERTCKALAAEFTIADERAFEQDPRFGLCVLAEIAQRSLPPTMADSGTALDVLGRITSVLAGYADAKDDEVVHERVWVPALAVEDLFMDAFNAISREAAGMFEVQAKLHKCLYSLAQTGDPDFRRCAEQFSRLAIQRTDSHPTLMEWEKMALRALAL